jgi:hypothetical protein
MDLCPLPEQEGLRRQGGVRLINIDVDKDPELTRKLGGAPAERIEAIDQPAAEAAYRKAAEAGTLGAHRRVLVRDLP